MDIVNETGTLLFEWPGDREMFLSLIDISKTHNEVTADPD